MMYRNHDSEERNYSLHDCRALKMEWRDSVLSFYFPDGFWVLDTHRTNKSNDVVKTDASKVDFHAPDGERDEICIYLFSDAENGTTVREELKLVNVIDAVNNGEYCIEFIEQYKGYQSILYKCWAWFEQAPYHKEFEITIPVDKITFCWNHLRENRKW